MIKHANLIAALLLSGCATSPVPLADSQTVPPNGHLPGFAAFAIARANTAKVIVVRDSGFFGMLAKARVSVDGIAIATLGTGERLEFYLPVGNHIFGVILQPEFTHTIDETSFPFEANKSYYFRITSDEGGHCHIQPSTLLR